MNRSTRNLLQTLLLCALASLPSAIRAQATDPPRPAADGNTIEKIKFRVVPLGHRRLAKFERSKKARTIRIKSPDGETIEETIPAGVPIEIMGNQFEYLPPLAYIPQKNSETGEKFLVTPLSLNASVRELTLKNKGRLDLYIRQPTTEHPGEFEMVPYASAATEEGQSHLLMILVNNHKSKEGWKRPMVKTFNNSPKNLRAQELFLFNGTPFPLQVEFPKGAKFTTLIVKPYQSAPFRPNYNSKGRTQVRARLVAPNGDKRQFFFTSLKLNPDQRGYLMAYFDPRKHAANPAGMVQFKDSIQLQESEPAQ